jgi:hypothetical protein
VAARSALHAAGGAINHRLKDVAMATLRIIDIRANFKSQHLDWLKVIPVGQTVHPSHRRPGRAGSLRGSNKTASELCHSKRR